MKKEQRAQNKLAKEARAKALQLIIAQPELGDREANAEDRLAHFALPHTSHLISELQGDHRTIYCRRCGCWSSKLVFKGLGAPCSGLKKGNSSTLRLLRCGVFPTHWCHTTATAQSAQTKTLQVVTRALFVQTVLRCMTSLLRHV